ncbi:MAG: SIR2 family protein [Theionarchaea archaeon]|nr:SIR2 family protein [Theionarchaea archaeon]
MVEISEEQSELLERLEKRLYPPGSAARIIAEFILGKPEEEPLDSRWIEIWDENKRSAKRYLGPNAYKKISGVLENIVVIDDKVWDIKISDDVKVVFLLGAGASAPSNIPTVDKLLPELWRRAKKIGRDDLDRLNKWCDMKRITNIEDLLTAAYMSNFVVKNPNITALTEYFLFLGGSELPEEKYTERHRIRLSARDVSSISFLQDTLQTLFGLLASTMIPADPNLSHSAIVDFIKEHKNSSIITTNYDGCMDEAILNAGLTLKGTLESPGRKHGVEDTDGVELIKMHGSINWVYCESCQDVKEFELPELKDAYTNDKLGYPVISICPKCGGQRRPLLVPPLSFKFLMFPNLVEIWNNARQKIDKANYLVIIGYSFSEADTYITKIISRAMSENEEQQMIVVNPDSHLVPSLRERLSRRIDNFKGDRIINVCENCENILPEILDSMLGKGGKKRKKK